MKSTVLATAAAAVLLFSGGQGSAQAPAQKTCNAPLGWWESKGLMPLFTSPNGPSPTTDCDFHVWSWTAFVNAMQTDPTTGQPMFLSLPTYDDLLSGNAARAAAGPRTLALKPRSQKPKALSSIQQAGSEGVLVDQNGRVVYYATHMDLTYFNFTKQYFGPANYANAGLTLPYPIAATVFKTSWRILASGENPTNAYTTTATIDLLESDGEGGLRRSGQSQSNVRVALVGVHVVGVIKDHPEFAWGTFEHLNNAPDLPDGMSPMSPNPVSQQMFTFYKAGTPANECNQNSSAFKIDPATQLVSPSTNVFRQFAYGGATPQSRVVDITQANQNFQAGVKEHSSQVNAAFANYKLIGTVWIAPNSLQPGDGNLDTESIGSITLSNSTLETFVQGVGTSCFSCHNTSGGPNYPGKDINISHIILSGIAEAAARANRLRMNP